jgi:hypothetical protein
MAAVVTPLVLVVNPVRPHSEQADDGMTIVFYVRALNPAAYEAVASGGASVGARVALPETLPEPTSATFQVSFPTLKPRGGPQTDAAATNELADGRGGDVIGGRGPAP